MPNGDKVLFRWTPNQIAAMTMEEAQGVIEFHRTNPPTMDYIVEYMRSMNEMALAQDRINELTPTDPVEIAIQLSKAR